MPSGIELVIPRWRLPIWRWIGVVVEGHWIVVGGPGLLMRG